MTPKEKAKDLLDKFYPKTYQATIKPYYNNDAKQCALICVDEIINNWIDNLKFIGIENKTTILIFNQTIRYWIKVKQEIESSK